MTESHTCTLKRCVVFVCAAENDTHEGKRVCEAVWPIFKIAHQKSRYIYELYWKQESISKELYEFCLDQNHADRSLIAKWRKVNATPQPKPQPRSN